MFEFIIVYIISMFVCLLCGWAHNRLFDDDNTVPLPICFIPLVNAVCAFFLIIFCIFGILLECRKGGKFSKFTDWFYGKK